MYPQLNCRYLIEAPANVCTPTYLAHAAEHIAAISPDVMSLKVLEREQCQALGMGLFLGVAQGSDEPPKFIHLTYTPKEAVKRKVGIPVGQSQRTGLVLATVLARVESMSGLIHVSHGNAPMLITSCISHQCMHPSATTV